VEIFVEHSQRFMRHTTPTYHEMRMWTPHTWRKLDDLECKVLTSHEATLLSFLVDAGHNVASVVAGRYDL